jgi:hypothetical protein
MSEEIEKEFEKHFPMDFERELEQVTAWDCVRAKEKKT